MLAATGTHTYAPPPAPEHFAERDITGTVRAIRRPCEGFAIVELRGGRQVVGDLDADDLGAGCEYRFFGVWKVHSTYGEQFRASAAVLLRAEGKDGVIGYLSRGGLGLTNVQAGKLWRTYGTDAPRILRGEPARVAAEGVLPSDLAFAAADKLRADAANEPTRVALFELFAGRGVPRQAVDACIREWGASAPKVIKRDPFKMLVANIPGIGFKRADELYLDNGGNPHRLKRQMLAGWHAMRRDTSGNTWTLAGVFYSGILGAIGGADAARFDLALRLGVRAKWLETRKDAAGEWLADAAKANAERKLAKHIRRILSHRPRLPALDLGDPVSDHQRTAVNGVVGSPLAMLCGTPGTGKTFTAACLLRVLLKLYSAKSIAVCAPTGMAAMRITAAMQAYKLPLAATTIHSLLGAGGDNSFARDESNPLEASVIVVDETSMLDTDIAAALLAAVPPGGNVLFLGDPYQLAPVGHGAPLRDMLAGGVPVAMLTEVKRNDGAIVQACAAIKDGRVYTPSGANGSPPDYKAGDNLPHVEAAGDAAQLDRVLSLLEWLQSEAFNPAWDVQVLCPRNAGSLVGGALLNERLQAVLNPPVPGELQVNPLKFRVGDKVMSRRNVGVGAIQWHGNGKFRELEEQHKITNGDQGRVLFVDSRRAIIEFFAPSRVVTVETRKPRATTTDESEADVAADLVLAYAITGHKSQGSEWPVVIVVIDDAAGLVATREWLYTVLSRGARLVVTVGRFAMLAACVARVGLSKRKTFLRELITEGRNNGF